MVIGVTGWAFNAGATVTGYILGGTLTLIGLLVSTTDICIPLLVFGAIFGLPPKPPAGDDKG